MLHAALIIAHKNKEQLIRLIKKISCPQIHVFVHLDKMWKLSKEDVSEIKECAENVFICKKRIHGKLDRWSLPQISLNLIDEALRAEKRSNVEYSYFILLSGQDYPIKSNGYILDFLKKQYPKPLVDYDPAVEGNWVWGKFQLTKWSNKIDVIQSKFKKGLIRSIAVGFCVIAYKLEKMFFGVPWDKLKKTDIKIYGGSAWWILPHGAIEYVDWFRKNNKKVFRQLKRAWTPEENFFNTIAMNSSFKKYVVDNDPIFNVGRGNFKAMTYCNFITPSKPFRGHPHIITDEDFDRVMAKKALFARKFDMNICSSVLDRIDKET